MNPASPPTSLPARRIELPRTARGGALARAFLDETVGPHVGTDSLEDARLAVSELVANAVLHGAGRITLEARLDPDALWVEVVDEGTGQAPAIREQVEADGGGWGLRIVDSVALSWGAHEGTTHVWAELPRA